LGNYKYYELEILKFTRRGNDMIKIKKINGDDLSGEDIGFILWQLEGIENFYPVYKTMIKKD
jgi:hypothetical protein